MADWVTISSLATAGGTLVLAVATFSSVRSANRSARLAELSLLAGVRPILTPSHDEDPEERIRFGDSHVLTVSGHGGAIEEDNGNIYMAIGLRNGGNGIAVLHGWRATPRRDGLSDPATARQEQAPDLSEFRTQQLDLYIPPGERGYWQGALRDPSEPSFAAVQKAVRGEKLLQIDLLYGDNEGGQRTIVRFSVSEWPEMQGERTTVLRYWNVDRADPR
ncbi:MAG: hypothetical protein WAK93_17160 [Solirubrobacteraceae bacterium]